MQELARLRGKRTLVQSENVHPNLAQDRSLKRKVKEENVVDLSLEDVLNLTATLVPSHAMEIVVHVKEIETQHLLGEMASNQKKMPFLEYGDYDKFDARFMIWNENLEKIKEIRKSLEQMTSNPILFFGKKSSGKTTTLFHYSRFNYSLYLDLDISNSGSVSDFKKTVLHFFQKKKPDFDHTEKLMTCWIVARCILFLQLCRFDKKPSPLEWLCLQLPLKANLPFFSSIVRIFDWVIKNHKNMPPIERIIEETMKKMEVPRLVLLLDHASNIPHEGIFPPRKELPVWKKQDFLIPLYTAFHHSRRIGMVLASSELQQSNIEYFLAHRKASNEKKSLSPVDSNHIQCIKSAFSPKIGNQVRSGIFSFVQMNQFS